MGDLYLSLCNMVGAKQTGGMTGCMKRGLISGKKWEVGDNDAPKWWTFARVKLCGKGWVVGGWR